ncbi:axotactin isoform X2 [Parasteatoda tepidariorum]|uniref:axotactin isoform X2 n=1 Tax=Parasteatoda tepidariorum TaxID=114398 RepID=UPI001C727655|nr:contactin-associated protein-like 5 isoform X1 [Parasteatoda tepidariorum]
MKTQKEIAMLEVMFIVCLISSVFSSESEILLSSQLFTFAQPQSFLQVKPVWSLPSIREVTFQFRTTRPHGLLLFHGSVTDFKIFPLYELYVMLENGQIKVIRVFHDYSDDTIFIGKGLNRDKWHYVTLRINPGGGVFSVKVDTSELTVTLPSLFQGPNNGFNRTLPQTVMYFGGLDPNNYDMIQKYNYVRFVGCMGNITFSESDSPFFPAEVIKDNHLQHGCLDSCAKKNPCLYNGRCINHYTHASCDCFGTNHEDQICFSADPVTVTFKGYSYITYRLYDWRDRVHSEAMRISFQFKTFFEDSVLLYASGDHPTKNYVALSLFGGQLHFEINFGDGPLNSTIGYSLNDEAWHTLTILHHGMNVNLQLDSRWKTSLKTSPSHHHLHLDPEIYIGSAPKDTKGLKSTEKFIGCLRSIYFNDKNVLYALHSGDSTARYNSIFAVEYGCESTNVIPVTFPLPESKLVLVMPNNQKLELSLEFKTLQSDCVLASGEIKTEIGIGVWELLLHQGTALFVISESPKEDPNMSWTLNDKISGKNLADDDWHHVGVVYDAGEVKLAVDYHHSSKGVFTHPLEFMGQMILTTSVQDAERGFIGCMRDIYVAGDWIDPRTVVDTNQVSGKVSLDSCLLVNLCNNPYACEHGGTCYVEKGETYCDCEKTGYTGRTCHFSLYKRTCEELYLVGYRKKGVYTIDIDRNGPLPSAHVYCDMGSDTGGQIITRVENNMPPEMVVRKKGMKSFTVEVAYREFTPEMLQSLVRHSKVCSQYMKYECFKTPLGLRTYTWMESSGSKRYITSIGSQSEGCKCAENHSCANSSFLCNCDIADARWRVDDGDYTSPTHLGITKIYILQPDNLDASAEGRLTLGPLECVETDTQEYVITFKTWNSFIEVPGWRRGDIAFSFRTSNSQAVLIYQSSIHHSHGYLRVLLINDYELSFEFTLNNRPRSVRVTSRRKLNSGEWQQVWVDHDTYHMRFTVNLDSVMVDYGESHGVGPFEGPLYVGGVLEAVSGDSSIKEGFIGCFRGLVINDVVVDLYKHMTRSESAIVHGCQPSCASSPCQNGATCVEYWGSYMCDCVNPFAHSGKNCETNININAMTVVTPGSYYHHKNEGNETNPVLEKDILLNFRTFEKEGILLYAFDHYNNFVQLHFANKKVYFTFNSDQTVYQLHAEAQGLSKGLPVQIKVERQLQRTTLFVNDKNSSADVVIKFVGKYFRMPWRQNQELETVFPPRGTYRTIDHNEMFLGHVGSGTSTNFTKSGFVGCIQGFMIGDKLFDLEAAALTDNADAKNGDLAPGCAMLCDSLPCHNHGLCIEHWKDNTTSCDCSLTSYTGEACQKDIGGNFDGYTLLTYSFQGEEISDEMRADMAVRLAFSTDAKAAFQVLLFIQLQERRYILFGLAEDNALFVEERITTNIIRRKAMTSNTWSDNNRHWFYFSWKAGIVNLIVDGKTYNPFIQVIETSSETYEGIPNLLYVAGLPKEMNKREYGSFKGCISNIMIEFGNLKLMPLETAFGYKKGSLDKIKVDGTVNERKCAAFAQLSQLMATLPSNIPPEIQGLEWFPEPLVTADYKSVFADMEMTPLESISRTSNRVAAVMGVMLLIVVLALLLYIYRIHRRHKRERLGEDIQMYSRRGKRRPTTCAERAKAVSFSQEDERIDDDYDEGDLPLVGYPKTPLPNVLNFPKPPFGTTEPNGKGIILQPDGQVDSVEIIPLRSTSSQELEWDPTGAQLVSTALEDMNPEEPEKPGDNESYDEDTPLPQLKNQFAPLASASEVTINRLSQTFA